MEDRHDGLESAWPEAVATAPEMNPRTFAVLEDGRVAGDGDLAVNTAEALLYVARVTDAIGYKLGAGRLEAVEVFGAGSAYAAVDARADGSLTLRGCVEKLGFAPEDLRAWLEARAYL